ncbi:uncharacterized protein LOC6585566 [Drosophila mojavensis]|uniref:Uncharacterized protein n=1 Tax=Drosophila mojavensis TaxID=7230 RepID=B4L6P0_DROMO|nr:uncharacterized protein LOC6585566 [Drosophila mojavensis]EDW06036.1 uncharacterized protein Dmoj_GI16144 [Drosophila mojavensis]
MSFDNFVYNIKRENPEILTDVRRVLSSGECFSPERTMSLSQIRAGYKKLTDWEFPNMVDPRTELCFLLSEPYIAGFANKQGTFRFYIVPHAEK